MNYRIDQILNDSCIVYWTIEWIVLACLTQQVCCLSLKKLINKTWFYWLRVYVFYHWYYSVWWPIFIYSVNRFHWSFYYRFLFALISSISPFEYFLITIFCFVDVFSTVYHMNNISNSSKMHANSMSCIELLCTYVRHRSSISESRIICIKFLLIVFDPCLEFNNSHSTLFLPCLIDGRQKRF